MVSSKSDGTPLLVLLEIHGARVDGPADVGLQLTARAFPEVFLNEPLLMESEAEYCGCVSPPEVYETIGYGVWAESERFGARGDTCAQRGWTSMGLGTLSTE